MPDPGEVAYNAYRIASSSPLNWAVLKQTVKDGFAASEVKIEEDTRKKVEDEKGALKP